MNNNKLKCRQWKAQFYSSNQAICGTCDKPYSPNCSGCACALGNYPTSTKKKIIANLKDITSISEDQIVEITTT